MSFLSLLHYLTLQIHHTQKSAISHQLSQNTPLSLSPHQPSRTRTIPRKSPTPLPPLSKGGGLTARHKLLLCCFLLAICPLFLYCKLFCRQDGGIALHHRPFQNRTIPRKRGGSVARSSRANYGGDCSCLEVVFLIALVLVLSLFHIDKCTHSNSETEKCCPTKRTIGS